jgi:hypothetical protein
MGKVFKDQLDKAYDLYYELWNEKPNKAHERTLRNKFLNACMEIAKQLHCDLIGITNLVEAVVQLSLPVDGLYDFLDLISANCVIYKEEA